MSDIILIVANKRYSYLSFYIPSSVYGKIILFSTNNIAKKTIGTIVRRRRFIDGA